MTTSMPDTPDDVVAAMGWKPSIDDQTMADLTVFGVWMKESSDLDPAYPVLKVLQEGMEPDQAVYHSLLYVAFYNIASGHAAFQANPANLESSTSTLATGTERRGFRGGRIAQHLVSLQEQARAYGGGWLDWLTSSFTASPVHNYYALRAVYEQVWGNGRWASYKLADVLRYVNGLPIHTPDMGMKDATGPRDGLMLVYRLPTWARHNKHVDWLEGLGYALQEDLARVGLGLHIDQVETLMCDFHSLASGRYYVGHDIDLMQEQMKPWVGTYVHDDLLNARSRALPLPYLGEVGGWEGRDESRMTAYRDRGVILQRE